MNPIETREETLYEYFNRITFEKDLEYIDFKINQIIQEICQENKENIELYHDLIHLYSYLCLEEESKFLILSKINGIKSNYAENAIRLNEKGNLFYLPYELRKKAFSYKKIVAMRMLNEWMKTHSSTENCPNTYQDTLNIPFQQIKKVEDSFRTVILPWHKLTLSV